MNHTIGRLNIGGDDVGAVDRGAGAVDLKGDLFALQGRCLQAIRNALYRGLAIQDMEAQGIGQFRQCQQSLFGEIELVA